MCREVTRAQLEDEGTGILTIDPRDWWVPSADISPTQGARFVWGVIDGGVPQRVTVGDQPCEIRTAGPFWGCSWDVAFQAVQVAFPDHVEHLGGRPHYLPKGPDPRS